MTSTLLRKVRASNRSPMTLDGTRTFVLGADRPIVIDPGPADETHLQAVERALAGHRPRAILLTHAHADHSGNALPLAARTGAPIWMGPGALREPFAPDRVGRWLVHGDEIETDSGGLTVLATPGHTGEHLAFLWVPGEGGRILFAGDLFLGLGDTTLVSHPEGSVSDYLRSLEVVEECRPHLVYPAHGPALRRPEATVRRYREHRLQRIAEVRQVLDSRPGAGADEVAEAVYGAALDPALRSAARGSVRAMMEYLAAGSAG